MNSTDIKNILRSPYNRDNWKNLYRKIFQNKVTFHEIPYEYNINEEIVESLFQIGYATLDDEYMVALFEVNIKKNVNLLSKKIGLRKVISKYISDDKFNGVLTIFENGSPDYRFTFASKVTKVTEEGIETTETESKRYTYILGGNEPCLTPSQRFETLFKKNGNINLDDIKEAFSVEKLNKEFFNGYKEHYEMLCEYFYNSKYKIKVFKDDDKIIRDFVKKFLGRIVFLYFVQKKGWLGVYEGHNWGTGDHQFLSNLFKDYNDKEKFYSKVVSKIFFDCLSIERKNDTVNLFDDKVYRIPYLNGGLFEKELIDDLEINFDSSHLSSLFNFFDRFNFTIYEDDPNEHTVAVDPEMLGHIFENLLEDNKDKGAFYTPKEIVHYMCQESLIEYLTTWFENKGYEIIGHNTFDTNEQTKLFPDNDGRKGQLVIDSSNTKKIDRVLIEKLLKKQLDDEDKNYLLKYSTDFHLSLDSVKICDPAIGSGAFPMGLLQEIFITKQTLWNFEHGNLNEFPSSKIKLNIIQNSIYGVDIEKGAVDIARLRFWLSLIVDEEEPKSLPNLDYKIVVGNSLLSSLWENVIDIDWNLNDTKHGLFSTDLIEKKGDILHKIVEEQKEIFNSVSNKFNLNTDIRNLKIDLIINQLELMITTKGLDTKPNSNNKKFSSQIDLYNKTINWKDTIDQLRLLKNDLSIPFNFFDWKLDFPEIMNNDINSYTGFDIVIGNPPYVFSRDNMSNEMKKNFNDRYKLTQFKINLYILFIEKGYNLLNKSGTLCFITPNNWLTLDTNSDLREFILTETFNIKILQNYSNVFESASVDTVIIGFNKYGNKVVNYLEWINRKPTLISKKSTLDYLNKPKFIISQTSVNSQNSYINNIQGVQLQDICEVKNGVQAYTVGEGIPICTEEMKKNRVYHSNVKHDEKWFKYLDGVDVGRYNLGWSKQYLKYGKNLSRPRQFDLFNGERILVRQIPNQLPYCINATYTNELSINDNNSMIIKVTNTDFNIKYLLGILNSRLISNWFALYFGKLTRKIFPQFKINELRIFPIYKSNKLIQNKIENLVNQIYYEKSMNIDSSITESKVDLLVYKIYEISYRDIIIIDPNFDLTENQYDSFDINDFK
jgi:hypothetical protein